MPTVKLTAFSKELQEQLLETIKELDLETPIKFKKWPYELQEKILKEWKEEKPETTEDDKNAIINAAKLENYRITNFII